jgi:hypothetical protein
VSVDTYLKGKRTDTYQKVYDDDLEIMVSPKLLQFAQVVELVTKKQLLGTRLAVVAHHVHGPSCAH